MATSTKWDANLKTVISGLKSLNKPVQLAPLYEFDHRVNGYAAKDVVAVFKKAKQFISDAGASNISIVWVSAGIGSGVSNENRMSRYPGDDVVDVWGWNLYDPQVEQKNMAEGKYCLKSYAEMAASRNKPVMIHESCSVGVYAVQRERSGVLVENGKASLDNWFKPFFELVYSIPNLKFFNYGQSNFTADRKTSTFAGNGIVSADPLVLAWFQEQAANPLFVYADGEAKPYWEENIAAEPEPPAETPTPDQEPQPEKSLSLADWKATAPSNWRFENGVVDIPKMDGHGGIILAGPVQKTGAFRVLKFSFRLKDASAKMGGDGIRLTLQGPTGTSARVAKVPPQSTDWQVVEIQTPDFSDFDSIRLYIASKNTAGYQIKDLQLI